MHTSRRSVRRRLLHTMLVVLLTTFTALAGVAATAHTASADEECDEFALEDCRITDPGGGTIPGEECPPGTHGEFPPECHPDDPCQNAFTAQNHEPCVLDCPPNTHGEWPQCWPDDPCASDGLTAQNHEPCVPPECESGTHGEWPQCWPDDPCDDDIKALDHEDCLPEIDPCQILVNQLGPQNLCPPDPSITKTFLGGEEAEGDGWLLEFEVTVTNAGPGILWNADLDDFGLDGGTPTHATAIGEWKADCWSDAWDIDSDAVRDDEGSDGVACDLPPVFPDEERTIRFGFWVPTCGPWVNNVQLSWFDQLANTTSGARPLGSVGSGHVAIPHFTAAGTTVPLPNARSAQAIADVCPAPLPPPVPVADPSNPGVSLSVQTSPATAAVGDTVTVTWTVLNTGDVPLGPLGLTEELTGNAAGFGPFSLSGRLLGGVLSSLLVDPASGTMLAPGANLSTTTTHTITEGHLPGPFQVAGTATGGGVSDTASAAVTLVTAPALAVTVTPDQDSHQVLEDGPTTVNWTYVVTNIGDVTLTGVTLVDALSGAVDLGAFTVLAPGKSATAMGTYIATPVDVVVGGITTAATATGQVFDGSTVQAVGNATVALSSSAQEAEVLGVIAQRPDPVSEADPDPAPAPAVAAEELPATGRDDAALAALALLLATLGLWTLESRAPTPMPAGRRRGRPG